MAWLRFLRRLLGRDTVADVADEFPRLINVSKVILCRWFAFEFQRGAGANEDDARVLAAQVVNVLFAEHPTSVDGMADDKAAKICAAQREAPEVAMNLMRQDANLRQLIVEALRIRLLLLFEMQGFAGTERDRVLIEPMLELYGKEFPEEPKPARLRHLVRNLIEWAGTPAYPPNSGGPAS